MHILAGAAALGFLALWTCVVVIRGRMNSSSGPGVFQWLTSVIGILASVVLAFTLDSYLGGLETERAIRAEETRVLSFLDSYLDYVDAGFTKLDYGADSTIASQEGIALDSFPSAVLRDAVGSGFLTSQQSLTAYKLADDIDLFVQVEMHALQVVAADPSLDGRKEYLSAISASLGVLKDNILKKIQTLSATLDTHEIHHDEEKTMTQFEFWSLVVGSIAAAATFCAVFAALWGERLRQRWSKPKLKLSLLSTLGELNETAQGVQGRYYGLALRNEKLSSPATNTRVNLLDIQVQGADAKWRSLPFTKPVQVSWRWPQRTPPLITVGAEEVASFLFLMRPDAFLQLQLPWCPNNLDRRIPPDQPTRLVFQAVSDTAVSNVLTVDVKWDGEWSEEASQMAQHLVVQIAGE